MLEKNKSKGRILPFVRGLRLSAHLIYILRNHLEGSNLDANWGHILVNDGEICSAECDIIIHKKCEAIKWNGNEKSIMDFRFIPVSNVVTVISCKSYIRANDVEIQYFNDLHQYVNKIWLFAECCGPRSYTSIDNRAKKIGYENFWCLYTYSCKKDVEHKQDAWLDFLDKINTLKTKYP